MEGADKAQQQNDAQSPPAYSGGPVAKSKEPPPGTSTARAKDKQSGASVAEISDRDGMLTPRCPCSGATYRSRQQLHVWGRTVRGLAR